MIAMSELIKEPLESLPQQHQDNLSVLLLKLNQMRTAYGKPLRVTSGYRSMADHLRIYAEKGITDQSRIPMQSRHLSGEAADLVALEESVDSFHQWVKDNIKLMEEIGFWFEDFGSTKTWTHFQIATPKSGNRFFIP